MNLFNKSVAMICLAVAATVAHAEEAALDFNIPPQPVSQVLDALARQTGLQPVYADRSVQGIDSPGVTGRYSLREALAKALAGTGLTFQFTAEKTVAIKPGGAAGMEEAGQRRAELLPEVVVTATKTAASIREVPFAVSVVSADTIGQQSPKDLSDILRREAGVDINRSTPLGVATVSVRGGDSASQRTQVLIDGQPSDFISTGVGGLTAIQIIDPLNVERVEIVRGAGSALYGPGAVGGVVNVITKRGDPDKSEVRFFAGADELGSNHLGFSGSGGDRATGFTYRIAGKHSYYGGYKPAPAPTPNGNQSLQDIHDRENTAGGRLGFWLSARNELALTFNGRNSRGDSFGRPETRHVIKNGVLGLESNNWLSDTYLLSAAISQRSHRGDYDFDSYFYPFILSTVKTSTLKEAADKISFDLKNQWDVAVGHRLLFGLQYIRDEASLRYFTPATGAQQDDRGGDIANLGFYLQEEMRFGERWFVTAGLRHDRFDYSLHYTSFTTAPVTNRTVNKNWQTTNPRLGTRFRLTEATDLRASIGKAFRAPDTFGLMGRQLTAGLDYRPNPNLDAEKSTAADIGVDHDFGSGLKASATVYRTEIKDAMVITRTSAAPMVLQWGNLGKLVNEGIELEVKKRFGDVWQTYANYTHNVSRAASDPPAGAIGWPCNNCKLPLNPVHKLSFGATWKPSDSFTVRGDGRHVSESYAVGDTKNTAANRLPGHFVADLKATWYWKLDKDRAELSAGVRNLTDKQYAVRAVGSYEEPRTAFVQLGYTLF